MIAPISHTGLAPLFGVQYSRYINMDDHAARLSLALALEKQTDAQTVPVELAYTLSTPPKWFLQAKAQEAPAVPTRKVQKRIDALETQALERVTRQAIDNYKALTDQPTLSNETARSQLFVQA
jgi:hypothetical protein